MPREGLNEGHERRLLTSCQYADKLLSEIEGVLDSAASKSPFQKYERDISLLQAKVVRDYMGRIRNHLVRVLDSLGISAGGPKFGSIHSIRVHLGFIRIAMQEIGAKDLAGYGAVP